MFAFAAAGTDRVFPQDLRGPAAALRGGAGAPALWCDEQGRAGLVHRPAGILPEDSFDRQPFVSDSLVFVAQARIDNREELLTRLGTPREQRSRLCDGDVLRLAYQQWGEDCVRHVYGDFAYAAWHRDSGRISAAVDHIGMVALYYAQSPAGTLLSTQLGALLAHPKTPRDLDLTALGLLAAPKIAAGTTPYAHISRLLGGERLTAGNRAPGVARWWRPDAAPVTRYRDPRDYAAAASEVFGCAMTARLRASGRIAATMSGGLDSTLVASSAARALAPEGRPHRLHVGSRAGTRSRSAQRLGRGRFAFRQGGRGASRQHGACAGDAARTLRARHRAADPRTLAHAVRNGANHVWMARIAEAMEEKGEAGALVGEKGNAAISTESDWYIAVRCGSCARDCCSACLVRIARRSGRSVRQALFGDVIGGRMKAAARHLLRRPAPRTVYRAGAFLFTQAFRDAVAGDLSGQPAVPAAPPSPVSPRRRSRPGPRIPWRNGTSSAAIPAPTGGCWNCC